MLAECTNGISPCHEDMVAFPRVKQRDPRCTSEPPGDNYPAYDMLLGSTSFTNRFKVRVHTPVKAREGMLLL